MKITIALPGQGVSSFVSKTLGTEACLVRDPPGCAVRGGAVLWFYDSKRDAVRAHGRWHGSASRRCPRVSAHGLLECRTFFISAMRVADQRCWSKVASWRVIDAKTCQ